MSNSGEKKPTQREPRVPEKRDTPGRPGVAGSRQQTHFDQVTQSGNPELDRKRKKHPAA